MNTDNTNFYYSEKLAQSLSKATLNNRFYSDKFFLSWFRESGTPYYFLFKKNHSITNIQVSELLSLIRGNIKTKNQVHTTCELAFHTTNSFSKTIEDIVRPTVESIEFKSDDLKRIAELYWPIIENAIVVDTFYTSCAIFIPFNLDIDIIRICGEAGYIHSCGYSIYVRRNSKATQLHLYEAINRHLDRYPEYVGKLQFIPYSNEDFNDDSDVGYIKDAIKDGIDGVKIKIEKNHMTNKSLVQILDEMKRDFSGRLIFRNAGHYKEEHPLISESTMWLISDRSVNYNNTREAGGEIYYICYHQLYLNDSPFHLFEENKPAWVAHTTIPHTLLGAMLNITKPWSIHKTVVIGDPFGGTGTTWLETLKYDNVKCIISDINPLFPILLKDNISFFALPKNQLLKYIETLEEMINKSHDYKLDYKVDYFPNLMALDNDLFNSSYTKATTIIKKLSNNKTTHSWSFDFTIETAHAVEQLSFIDRLIFYVVLRAEIRFQSAYARGTIKPAKAFVESAKYLVEEFKSLDYWCSRASNQLKTVGSFSIFSSRYSNSCGISFARLQHASNCIADDKYIRVSDARVMESRSCDILVTDPPYGFNTQEDLLSLASLYADFITVAINAIKDEGHLVLCLPNEANTGKSLPVCTKSQIITSQVLRSADALGREVYVPAKSSIAMTMPPYYWNSNALRRVILHFRIRDKIINKNDH